MDTTIDAHIDALEKGAEKLTPEQRDRLMRMLTGAPIFTKQKHVPRGQPLHPVIYVGKRDPNVTVEIPGQRTIDDQFRENHENGIRV